MGWRISSRHLGYRMCVLRGPSSLSSRSAFPNDVYEGWAEGRSAVPTREGGTSVAFENEKVTTSSSDEFVAITILSRRHWKRGT
jgi:hypothetical protein